MIRYAIAMGVAKLSELCIDGTRVRANASRHKTWTAECVEKLLKELDVQIETAMAELETNDSIDELFDDGTSPDKLPPELADLTTRRTKMSEVLEQLQEMDRRRKADAVDINALMAVSAFATGPDISGLEERGIEFLSPLSEVKSAFVYDAEVDQFHCPAGKTLSRGGQETRQTAAGPVLNVVYFGDECEGCELAPQCRKNPNGEKGRKLTRDEHETARERHSERMSRPESSDRYKQRRHFGEMPFAVMKVCFDMRRFLLRGREGVQAEWQWCCTAFNLKKLMNLIAALRAEQCETTKTEI